MYSIAITISKFLLKMDRIVLIRLMFNDEETINLMMKCK